HGLLHERGTGIFADALRQGRPELPLVEECALADEDVRFAFLCGVYLIHGWRTRTFGHGGESSGTRDFHARHGYIVAGFDTGAWKALEAACDRSDADYQKILYHSADA